MLELSDVVFVGDVDSLPLADGDVLCDSLAVFPGDWLSLWVFEYTYGCVSKGGDSVGGGTSDADWDCDSSGDSVRLGELECDKLKLSLGEADDDFESLVDSVRVVVLKATPDDAAKAINKSSNRVMLAIPSWTLSSFLEIK